MSAPPPAIPPVKVPPKGPMSPRPKGPPPRRGSTHPESETGSNHGAPATQPPPRGPPGGAPLQAQPSGVAPSPSGRNTPPVSQPPRGPPGSSGQSGTFAPPPAKQQSGAFPPQQQQQQSGAYQPPPPPPQQQQSGAFPPPQQQSGSGVQENSSAAPTPRGPPRGPPGSHPSTSAPPPAQNPPPEQQPPSPAANDDGGASNNKFGAVAAAVTGALGAFQRQNSAGGPPARNDRGAYGAPPTPSGQQQQGNLPAPQPLRASGYGPKHSAPHPFGPQDVVCNASINIDGLSYHKYFALQPVARSKFDQLLREDVHSAVQNYVGGEDVWVGASQSDAATQQSILHYGQQQNDDVLHVDAAVRINPHHAAVVSTALIQYMKGVRAFSGAIGFYNDVLGFGGAVPTVDQATSTVNNITLDSHAARMDPKQPHTANYGEVDPFITQVYETSRTTCSNEGLYVYQNRGSLSVPDKRQFMSQGGPHKYQNTPGGKTPQSLLLGECPIPLERLDRPEPTFDHPARGTPMFTEDDDGYADMRRSRRHEHSRRSDVGRSYRDDGYGEDRRIGYYDEPSYDRRERDRSDRSYRSGGTPTPARRSERGTPSRRVADDAGYGPRSNGDHYSAPASAHRSHHRERAAPDTSTTFGDEVPLYYRTSKPSSGASPSASERVRSSRRSPRAGYDY